MVAKLPPFQDDFMQESVSVLLADESKCLQPLNAFPGVSLWLCNVNQMPDARAYWIGNFTGGCVAYLIVEQFGLPGLRGQQAIRGWVANDLRGKGLFSTLMLAASAGSCLISDRDGMTEDAHNAWMNAKGYSRHYYDQHRMELVEPTEVPDLEKFTTDPAGRRWLLVLTPSC